MNAEPTLTAMKADQSLLQFDFCTNKKGRYFWGNFDAREHSAADNLLWLREKIDCDITFWKMSPGLFSIRGPVSTSETTTE